MNNINICEVVAEILASSNSEELCDRFEAAYNCCERNEDISDDENALYLMKAISTNNIDLAFAELCGVSATYILKKGMFIPDENHRFYDEVEDVEVKVLFDDNTRETVFCSLNTDTHELFNFEIKGKDKSISEITYNFCDLECEVYPKSEMYDDDKWSFWYDDLKWRKEE